MDPKKEAGACRGKPEEISPFATIMGQIQKFLEAVDPQPPAEADPDLAAKLKALGFNIPPGAKFKFVPLGTVEVSPLERPPEGECDCIDCQVYRSFRDRQPIYLPFGARLQPREIEEVEEAVNRLAAWLRRGERRVGLREMMSIRAAAKRLADLAAIAEDVYRNETLWGKNHE